MTVNDAIAQSERYKRHRERFAVAGSPPRSSLRADAPGTAHLYLYDSIGWPGIEAQPLVEQLRAIHTRPLVLHLNSPGGDVFDGLAIYNSLRQHGAPVDVRVEGYAASIASLIAMGGSTLRMAEASLLMIHNPHALVIGTSDDMRSMAQLLDQTAGLMADVYAKRGPIEREQIGKWMTAETWWTAREALAAGLIDAVDDAPLPAEATAASAAYESSGFRRPVPQSVEVTPTPRARLSLARVLIEVHEAFVA